MNFEDLTPEVVFTPGGLKHRQHGADRSEERGFSDQAIDAIVENNKKNSKRKVDGEGKVTREYTDPRGNTVVVNEDNKTAFELFIF